MGTEALSATLIVFGGGFGLVSFFGRRDLGRAWRGELGQRYLSWLVLAGALLFAAGALGAMGIAGLAAVLGVLAVREYRRHPLPAGLGLAWIGGGMAALALAGRVSPALAVALCVASGLADVGAYSVGKLCGRHVIAPRINPRKSWEGVAGSVLGASIGLGLFHFGLPELGWPALAALAAGLGATASAGDLLSSWLTRRAGVKDWGTILPGHGGILDRINSLCLAVPVSLLLLSVLAAV